MIKFRSFQPALMIVLFAFTIIHTEEILDPDKEISRIKKELASVSSQRQSIRQEAANDLKDHSSYKNRIGSRFKTVQSEIDSLSDLIHIYRRKEDSLSAVIKNVAASQKQYDLLQDNFRLRLIEACDRIAAQTPKIPPMSSKSIAVPAAFLKSELTSGNIDNIEGLQRLVQIFNNHEELTGSIQIFQSTSPVPGMQGTVYRLRIGSLFEAAVQSNGNRYALWNGLDSLGKEIWLIRNDREGAAQILNAVNIREGKALPAFAQIPAFGFTEGE